MTVSLGHLVVVLAGSVLAWACGSAQTDIPTLGTGAGSGGGGGLEGGGGRLGPTLRECTHQELSATEETYVMVQPQGFKTFTGTGVTKANASSPSHGMIISLDDKSTIELSGVNFPKFKDGSPVLVQFAGFAPGPRDREIVLELRETTGRLLFFSYRGYFDAAVLATFNAPFTTSFEPMCSFPDSCYPSGLTVLWTRFAHGGVSVPVAPLASGHLALDGGRQVARSFTANDIAGPPSGTCFDALLPGRYVSFQILDESLL